MVLSNLLRLLMPIWLVAVMAMPGTLRAQEEEPAAQPKIVVQVGHSAPVEAVVWAEDGKHLITLDANGAILAWDVANGNIVDRTHVPFDWGDWGLATDLGYQEEAYRGVRCLKLSEFSLSAHILSMAFEPDSSSFEGTMLGEDGKIEQATDEIGLMIACPNFERLKAEEIFIQLDVDTWEHLNSPRTIDVSQGKEAASSEPDEAATAPVADEGEDVPRPPAIGPPPPKLALAGGAVHVPEEKPGPDTAPAYFADCLSPLKCNYRLEPNVPGADGSGTDRRAFFPTSPDGKLHPRPNFDDGKPGYASQYADHGPDTEFDLPGCPSVQICRYGVNLYGPDGEVIELTGDLPGFFLDAEASPDGAQIARLSRSGGGTSLEVFNFGEGAAVQSRTLDSRYHRIKWLNGERLALLSQGNRYVSPMSRDTFGAFPPALLFDPDCAKSGSCTAVPSFTGMEPIGSSGAFIGIANADHCREAGSIYDPPMARSFCEAEPDVLGAEGNWASLPRSADYPDAPFAASLSVFPARGPGEQSEWHRIEVPGMRPGETITAIRVSPNGRTLAVATRGLSVKLPPDDPRIVLESVTGRFTYSQTFRVMAFDISPDGALAGARDLVAITESWDPVFLPRYDPFSSLLELEFTPDASRVLFTRGGLLFDAATESNSEVVFDNNFEGLSRTSGSGDVRHSILPSNRVVGSGKNRVFGLNSKNLTDLETGNGISHSMADDALVRAGYLPDAGVLWGTTDDGVIHYWDGETGAKILTFYVFPGNRFFAVTPEGRYDTNFSPDADLIRWVVPDAPWQSLAAQTFMRDFYEPRLYRKLLDCRIAGNCDSVFPPLPSLASLNRVLPKVEITGVVPGKDTSEAVVTVTVAEGHDPDAANGRTKSGIHNPRLFIDNRLVAEAPEQAGKARRKPSGEGEGEGEARKFVFRVPVSTMADARQLRFSAYAFNEDGIKSETASFTYERPPARQRARRAFIVNIGIDRYDNALFPSLSYAGNDADLLARRLATLPGYEVRQVTVGKGLNADGGLRPVNRATILNVLNLLVTDKSRNTRLRELAAQGIDASLLETATPDDIVIVSYSGHGWADERGNFYLIPSDVAWDHPNNAPRSNSVVSTDDLRNILVRVQASEISLIIDACHSAASVDNGEFKPGPMGDSGLGQLAYDKGIRILAATQADDQALEDFRLQQGLLTYALAAEGLTQDGGASDRDEDGDIRLDEWLAYAVERLPQLSEDIGRGNFRGIRFANREQKTRPERVQKPSLFDFNSAPSSIVLRTGIVKGDQPR